MLFYGTIICLVLCGVSIFVFTEDASSIWTGMPVVRDSDLEVEVIAERLYLPTNMGFIDNDTIIVTTQNGTVKLISNGNVIEEPLLKVNTSTKGERGLTGLEIMDNNLPREKLDKDTNSSRKNITNSKSVFLYYTDLEGEPRNKLYKYSWEGEALGARSLLLDLPAENSTFHNGGKIVIGPDNYLYTVIGDQGKGQSGFGGKLQNIINGSAPDDTGVIFRIDPVDGSPAPDNPFSSNYSDPLSKYYAYGIRNSYGLAFDPVTSQLWDTENGEGLFDEINLVKAGFNSGWAKIMGPLSRNANINVNVNDDLVHFLGSKYSDPVFSWQQTIGVTDLEFFNSTKFGPEYQNSLFVGDFNIGSLYNFKLNSTRSGFVLNSSSLSDLVADNRNRNELSPITFGAGFTRITDIQTGPDGLLYVLGYGYPALPGITGALYRIQPSE